MRGAAHRSTRRSSRAARSAWCRGCIRGRSDSTKLRADRRPVDVRAARATCALKLPTAPFHLPRIATAAQRCRARAQARDDVREFLAERGRARRLPVRARQHRQCRRSACAQCAQLADRAYRRLRAAASRAALQQPRVAEVVDVLGGAAEVHELQRRRASAPAAASCSRT